MRGRFGASSVSQRSALTVMAFVLQNPRTVPGIMQRVQPFQWPQPNSVHSEFTSSTESLANNNKRPQKQTHPCSRTKCPLSSQLCLGKRAKECLYRVSNYLEWIFDPDLSSDGKMPEQTPPFFCYSCHCADQRRVQVRFVVASLKMF